MIGNINALWFRVCVCIVANIRNDRFEYKDRWIFQCGVCAGSGTKYSEKREKLRSRKSTRKMKSLYAAVLRREKRKKSVYVTRSEFTNA